MTESTEKAIWRRSRSCGNGACIEVAKLEGRYLVRGTTTPEAEPLSFTEDEWVAFTTGVRLGDFDWD